MPRWDLVYTVYAVYVYKYMNIQSITVYVAKLLSRSFPHPSAEPGKIKHISESNSASHVLEPFSAVFSPVFVLDAQAFLSFLATETKRDWNGQPMYTSCRRNLLFSQFDFMVGVGPKDQVLWISLYSFNMAKPHQNMFALAGCQSIWRLLPHPLNSPSQTNEKQKAQMTKGNTRQLWRLLQLRKALSGSGRCMIFAMGYWISKACRTARSARSAKYIQRRSELLCHEDGTRFRESSSLANSTSTNERLETVCRRKPSGKDIIEYDMFV